MDLELTKNFLFALFKGITLRTPLTGLDSNDSAFFAESSNSPEHGFSIQNLDPFLAQTYPDYAISAVRAIYMKELNLLHRQSPETYDALTVDDGMRVLTSSKVIKDQLSRKGGIVTERIKTSNEWANVFHSASWRHDDGNNGESEIVYEVFFDGNTLNQLSPRNAFEATLLQQSVKPFTRENERRIQEYLAD